MVETVAVAAVIAVGDASFSENFWKPADSSHDADIIEMSLALYREDPSPHPVTAESVQKTLHILKTNPIRGRALVLEIDGKTAGYAFLISFWSNELGGEVCHIDELYVRPTYRSQGHGSALIEILIHLNHQRNPQRPLWPGVPVVVELEVTPDNSRGQKLYASLGFKPMKNFQLRRSLKAE